MNATQQKFKPILFSTEMVQAILAGRKTQTRRVIKDQLTTDVLDYATKNGRSLEVFTETHCTIKPGNILWVRETWQCADFEESWNDDKEETEYKICYSYKASNDLRPNGISVEDHHGNWIVSSQERYDELSEKVEAEEVEGRDVNYPSIHMPKEAARIFLMVTNVRVERLQDISEEDAIAEGIERYGPFGEFKGDPHPSGGMMRFRAYSKAARAYQDLWDSINGKQNTWKSNPWVWVYDFERIEKPENFI